MGLVLGLMGLAREGRRWLGLGPGMELLLELEMKERVWVWVLRVQVQPQEEGCLRLVMGRVLTWTVMGLLMVVAWVQVQGLVLHTRWLKAPIS